MSLTITTDVFCDHPGCCDWVHGTTGSKIESKTARIEAATGGWVYQKVEAYRGVYRTLDLCPAHADAHGGTDA